MACASSRFRSRVRWPPSKSSVVFDRVFRRAMSKGSPVTMLAARSGISSRRNWRAALLVVAVDLNRFPHAVDVVGVAAGERLGGRAVPGVGPEDGCGPAFAGVREQGSGGFHGHLIPGRLVQVDAVRAIEF